jgi:hypothetical protein
MLFDNSSTAADLPVLIGYNVGILGKIFGVSSKFLEIWSYDKGSQRS